MKDLLNKKPFSSIEFNRPSMYHYFLFALLISDIILILMSFK